MLLFQGWRHPWEGHGHGGHDEEVSFSSSLREVIRIANGLGHQSQLSGEDATDLDFIGKFSYLHGIILKSDDIGGFFELQAKHH